MSDENMDEQPVDEAQLALDRGLELLDNSRHHPSGDLRMRAEDSAVASLTASMAVSLYEVRTAALEGLELLKRFVEQREHPTQSFSAPDPAGAWMRHDGSTAWDEKGQIVATWDPVRKSWASTSGELDLGSIRLAGGALDLSPEGAFAHNGEARWDWDDEKQTWVAVSDEPDSAHRSEG